LWTSFVRVEPKLSTMYVAYTLHSARQDSLSRHTKVHDNPAKRRRSSAITPLTPIAPAGPSTEQAAQTSVTDSVVDQPPQYTTTVAPDFFPPTNQHLPVQYQNQMMVPDAPIDPMLMHDATIMPIITHQPPQAVAIDPMLNDDMSSFQNYALPHPEWHEPKTLPPGSVSLDAAAWGGAFPQQQPQSAMVGNPYYVPDGLSMQNIRDQQRTEWPQQAQHHS